MLEFFVVKVIDHKLDKLVQFTTRGKLSKCNIDGKVRTCICNEYDVPFMVTSSTTLIYNESMSILY